MERRLLLIVLGVIATVLIGGYVLIGVAADYMASRVPDKFEREIFGNLGARQSDWSDNANTDRLQRVVMIFHKLVAQNKLRDLEYKIYFDEKEKSPNAFALPGGNVCVTQGILDLVKGDIGLALVLGHEIGHQQYRHSLKRMGRSLLFAAFLTLLTGGGDGGYIVGAALGVADKAHSRDQELESDVYGMRLLHRTYGKLEGALEFFVKIEKETAARGSKHLAFLSTHPYVGERIEKLKTLALALDPKATPESLVGEGYIDRPKPPVAPAKKPAGKAKKKKKTMK